MDETADMQARRLTLGDEGGVETAQGNPFGPNAQGPLTSQAGVGEPGLVGLPAQRHSPPPSGSNIIDETNPDEDAYSHETGWTGSPDLPEAEGLVIVGQQWTGDKDAPTGEASWADAYDEELAAHAEDLIGDELTEPEWTEGEIGLALMRELARLGAPKAEALRTVNAVIARLHG